MVIVILPLNQIKNSSVFEYEIEQMEMRDEIKKNQLKI